MSRDFRHVMASFGGTPWAILPAKLKEIEAVLNARIRDGGAAPRAFDDDDYPPRRSSAQERGYTIAGGVAVIPCMGTITQRPSLFAAISGGCSADQLGRAVDAAAADRAVSAILLDFDSPGGSVFGIPECAAKIRAARDRKRVAAVANSMAASAAYWLASQASEVWCTPSGEVGSVGVIATHADLSRAYDKAGFTFTHVHAGRYKAELDDTAPLADDARDYLQQQVDGFYRMFVNDIAAGRRTSAKAVEDRFGQGRMLMAADALRAGMVDRVGTAEQALTELANAKGARGTGMTAAARQPDNRAGNTDAAKFRRQIAADLAALGLPTNGGNG